MNSPHWFMSRLNDTLNFIESTFVYGSKGSMNDQIGSNQMTFGPILIAKTSLDF